MLFEKKIVIYSNFIRENILQKEPNFNNTRNYSKGGGGDGYLYVISPRELKFFVLAIFTLSSKSKYTKDKSNYGKEAPKKKRLPND